jgi:hypothetical protein
MKITKTQLKRIIKEELEAVTEEDAQGGFIRGAKGAGKDRIKSREITVDPNGAFKASLISKAFDGELKVAGQLDQNSLRTLQQAGALEQAKVTPIQQELNDTLDEIISAYQGSELPESISVLQGLFNAGEHVQVKDRVTHLWNKLLEHHRKTGERLQHRVTVSFNTLNTLLRKMN